MNRNIYIQKNLENTGGMYQSKLPKVPHNKSDLVICNYETKVCMIVEFSCPLDINTTKKVSEKLEVYAPLVRNLQILHSRYKFEIAPIVVGAMGMSQNV